MLTQSADERTLDRLVREEILRDSAHRRGPKRNINKITNILVTIFTNDKLNRPALTIKDMDILKIKTDDLEDYLAFLSKFPERRPFLKAVRQGPAEGKRGAPLKEYRFDAMWIIEWEQESKPIGLAARMCLAPAEDVSPPSS